jgi:selT/selW/selH-like putative selenoprotein
MVDNKVYLIFSYSWGYRKVFEQYAAILHQKYPEISVEGDLYPPPDYKVMLTRALVCDKICIPTFVYALGLFL